jgi:hypothetical protein
VPTHLDAEAIALYAERGSAAPHAADIAAHLRECDACLREVAEARTGTDLAAISTGSAAVRRALPPRLARYLREKPPKPSSGTGIIAGVATLLGGAVGAIASTRFSEGMAFGDVRNEDLDASQSVEAHDMADTHGFTRPDPVIGTPHADGDYFPGQQSYSDTCAIRCQEFIIRQYTGANAPEKFFIDEARAHGWYHDGHGTSPEDVGKLLELHGIPVHRYVHANEYQLAAELGQGHKVIIGVDSDELWRQNPVLTDLRHIFGLGAADHAVVVSGIDTSDPDHVKVIISDPGTGEAAARYPMDQFVAAWRDSNFFMVATHEPPPPHLHLPEMSHFDYDAGHVDHVGALSWDEFQDAYNAHDEHALHRAVEHESHHHGDAHDDHGPMFDDAHDHHDASSYDEGFDTHHGHGVDGHHDDPDDGGGHHHD